MLEEFGNEGYSIIKNFESICTGCIIHMFDRLKTRENYINEIIGSFKDENDQEKLRNLTSIILEETTEPNHLVEIFGCYRYFGHPVVDEDEGVRDLISNTRMEILTDNTVMRQVSGAFNRMFILNFIKKNQRWPLCKISEDYPEVYKHRISKLVKARPLAITLYDRSILIEEWSYIDFKKELEFDYYNDFTELLSDTAISPYRENLYTSYNRDMLNISYPTNVKESRRTLLEILSRPEFDISRIGQIINSGNVPSSWLVVGLHAKEREIKIKARLFAMMTLEMRMYFASTEKNLANGILRYLPTQTMTWSEAELSKYLIRMTTPEVDKGFIPVIFSLDYTKFNQRWRYDSTKLIFRTFDQLYGTQDLYKFTHKFFEKALFYLSSNLSPPSTIRKEDSEGHSLVHSSMGGTCINKRKKLMELFSYDTDRTWIGQPGGCEGQRQKVWTSIVVATLELNRIQTGI